jgi:hypothetical protein
MALSRFGGPNGDETDFVGPDGILRGSVPTGLNPPLGRLHNFMSSDEIFSSGGQGTDFFRVFDDRGNLVSSKSAPNVGYQLAEDPHGGAIALVDDADPAGILAVEGYDENGAFRFRTELDVLAIGQFIVDRQGNTLVLGDEVKGQTVFTGPGPVYAQWVTHDGVASPVFQPLPPQSQFIHVRSLALQRVSGGVFILGDDWRQLDSLATQSSPAPAWLVAARPESLERFQLARNGQAYALISFGSGTSVCTTSVQIVTADGQSCGTATFPSPPGACATVGAQIGFDGTLLQENVSPTFCRDGSCACNWHWWTGFFH